MTEFWSGRSCRDIRYRGLRQRLNQARFTVNILEFKEDESNRSGFREKETIISCEIKSFTTLSFVMCLIPLSK